MIRLYKKINNLKNILKISKKVPTALSATGTGRIFKTKKLLSGLTITKKILKSILRRIN